MSLVKLFRGLTFASTIAQKRLCNDKSESSSAGRARPCQGRGREFESRLPLSKALEKGLCHFRTFGFTDVLRLYFQVE